MHPKRRIFLADLTRVDLKACYKIIIGALSSSMTAAVKRAMLAVSKEARYLRWLKDLQATNKMFDPNKLDEYGVSCMHHVAFCGYLSCLKWLVKKGGKLAARYVFWRDCGTYYIAWNSGQQRKNQFMIFF